MTNQTLPTKTVEHNGATFGKLTARQRAEIAARLRGEARAKFRADLRDVGFADPQDVLDRLEDWDATPRGLSDFIAYVNDMGGQLEVALLGLKRVKADATEADLDALDLGADDLFAVAAQVAGLKINVPEPAAGGEGSDPTKPTETAPPDVYGEATATTT